MHRYAPTLVQPGEWVADGNSWRLDLDVGLDRDPQATGDPLRRYIRRGRSIDYPHLRHYETWHNSGDGGMGVAYASKADPDAADPSEWNGKGYFGYYWDDTNNRLYVRTSDDGGGPPTRIFYIDEANAWKWPDRLADNYWSGISDPVPPRSWGSLDVTEMVRRWLGLNGYHQEPNFGLNLDMYSTYSYEYFYLSEKTDDPATPDVDESALRPRLIVTYYTPEPANLLLLAGGALPLLTVLRRRRGA